MIAGEIRIRVPGERLHTWLICVYHEVGEDEAIADHIRAAKQRFPNHTMVGFSLRDNKLARRR